MTKPLHISIRKYMIVMGILMTVAPFGIIGHSTLNQLNDATQDAFAKTTELAKNIESQQHILLAGAEQLAVTLSKIPAVQKRDRATANLILSRVIASNPQYANIAVIDTTGKVWASAVPPKRPVSVADKRYFRNVLATGKASAGEYNVSNVLRKPVLNFGFPLLDDTSGRLDGVIVVTFYLENYGSLTEKSPEKTFSIFLADHKGTILFSLNAPEISGKQDKEDLFRRMRQGPDAGTFEATGNSGIPRLFSYRKLRFKDEQIPYMYIRTGISKESILAHTYRNLLMYATFLSSVMLILIACAAYISKRGMFDKIVALRDATKRLADGDLEFRVAERVSGGELGELGSAFDDMSHRLAENIAERRQAAEEFEAIIQTTPDGFITLDAQGRILEANSSFCALVGCSRCELLTMNIADLEVMEQPETTERRLQKIIHKGRDRFETRLRRKDGGVVGIEVSAAYLPERGGRLYCFVRDTTERDLIQKELIKAQKLESISVLAGGIAHNFNNILTGVIGYISYARKHLNDPGSIREALDSAERAGFRAAGLARQLLTFSRGGDPVRTPVTVLNLLRESVSLFLNGTRVKTVIDCPAELTVKVDREQMDQAFNNIVLNALQSMPEGGTLTVRVVGETVEEGNVYALSQGEYLKISFEDTGCGIDDDTLIRVFDLYFTTKGTGTGLGLSTTQSIVKKHGGHIDIASQPGRGTTVTILLPSSSEPATLEARPTETAGATVRSRRSVLLMDDLETIRTLTARMLRGTGYCVDTCEDGEEAIALYKAAMERGTPYATAIMDLTIPGRMGGAEAARQILELDPGAFLIVSSGYSDNPVMAEYRQYGFCAALVKPYNLEDLTGILDGIVR